MEFLEEVSDVSKGIDVSSFREREAARAILFDEDNLVPIMFVSNHNYHKLLGGGIDEGETILEALDREILEEVGSTIKVLGDVGKILEYREKFNLKQISHCFFGDVISKGEPNLDQHELDRGFQVKWVNLDEAISLLETDEPSTYEGSIIQKRDLIFLRTCKDLI